MTEFWKDAIQTGINDPVIANQKLLPDCPMMALPLLGDLEPLGTETIPEPDSVVSIFSPSR